MSINTRLVKLEKSMHLVNDKDNYQLVFCNDGESTEQALTRLAIDINDGQNRIAIHFE